MEQWNLIKEWLEARPTWTVNLVAFLALLLAILK